MLHEEGEGHAVLSVQDSGSGIPADPLERVFDAGWRATTFRTPEPMMGRTTGAGLGLAIVRGIVEAHEGTVSVASAPGRNRFAVTLPPTAATG